MTKFNKPLITVTRVLGAVQATASRMTPKLGPSPFGNMAKCRTPTTQVSCTINTPQIRSICTTNSSYLLSRSCVSLHHRQRSYSTQQFDPFLPSSNPYGPQKGDHITLALSGGVDSSVCALLLSRSNLYSLSAVFMRNWNTLDESSSFEPGSGGSMGCEWQRDWEDVQKVCRHLGNIPVELMDLSKEYWTQVWEPALVGWSEGVTPNPDVGCNKEIKFGKLMERVLFSSACSSFAISSRISASSPSSTTVGRGEELWGVRKPKKWLATGHYANISYTKDQGRPKLMRAKDPSKDQTYYLSSVPERSLSHACFPLGNLFKSQVRSLARQFDLPTSEKSESMGICFIGTRQSDSRKGVSNKDGFSSFLNEYICLKQGNIVDGDTRKVVGSHQGLHTFTVGQGARISGSKSKYYVARKDTIKNEIVVVKGKFHPMLMCSSLHVKQIDWIWNHPPKQLLQPSPTSLQVEEQGKIEEKGDQVSNPKIKLLAQVRHRQTEVECLVYRKESNGEKGGYTIEFVNNPVLAVAPGQILALWKGSWCLGSGVISSVKTLWDDEQLQQ
ncbi:related to trna methyltransferase [Melanopsichium pennsylvanicum]|uniref:tRNA-5-taurinomethyluridine 2-sulfurtransferase n=1 Tax=Melanopsichium pennsylvanicum TaxID=63383 RepID=A0AAJ5C2I5_9BASI|nr:related to trna methyltransferase [Melanopsichium pennsylvanicum]